MAKTFTTEQKVKYSFEIDDGRKRPKDPDGDPTVVSSDETVVTVTPLVHDSVGKFSFEAISVSPGTARIAVTADVNMSPTEVTELVGFEDIEITLDPRTAERTITIASGDPEDD